MRGCSRHRQSAGIAISEFLFILTFVGALVLGLGFLWCALRFARELDRLSARRLFFASILYLPLLLGLMVFDKR